MSKRYAAAVGCNHKRFLGLGLGEGADHVELLVARDMPRFEPVERRQGVGVLLGAFQRVDQGELSADEVRGAPSAAGEHRGDVASAGDLALAYRANLESRLATRILAEHARTMTVMVADGVRPSNEERGYVLRRIIRRAIRHGYKLGQTKPFFHRVVADLVKEMGAAYPELAEQQARIEAAEVYLKRLGCRDCRVRLHHDDLARIERPTLSQDRLQRVTFDELGPDADLIVQVLRAVDREHVRVSDTREEPGLVDRIVVAGELGGVAARRSLVHQIQIPKNAVQGEWHRVQQMISPELRDCLCTDCIERVGQQGGGHRPRSL